MSLPVDFFRQNTWANLQMVERCRGLTDEQLDSTAIGTYGSIRDTLSHIVSAEGTYATQLGHPPARRLQRGDPWPGFEQLAEFYSLTGAALEAAADEDPERMLRVGTENAYDVRAAVILVQMFHHGTEHRSQINSILTGLGLEPSELSGWEWGLATDRMRRA